MQNPYFRAVTVDGVKVDVNLNQVMYLLEADQGCTLVFSNGASMAINLTAAAVRGRTRKAWPAPAGEATEEA